MNAIFEETTTKRLFVHLEFVRGMAALVVLASHLRAFIFVDYSQIINPGFFEKLFYFVSGLGHEAVMIFFVLSGFLITKSIDKMIAEKRWSWSRYLVNRLSRLWAVLVPALILTFIWDSLGKQMTASVYYSGDLNELYNSGPFHDIFSNYNMLTFIQNIFFLQTITVPSYGTNGPLWSLAYEFWYYLIFPLGYTAFLFREKTISSLISLCILFLIVINLTENILFGGLVWLIGYFIGVLDDKEKVCLITKNFYFLLFSLFVFGMALVSSRTGFFTGVSAELVVGSSFGILMLALLRREVDNKIYIRISKFLSNISFTLYLVHFPLLGFACSALIYNQQFQPNEAVGLYVFLYALVVLYAYMIYLVFEKNTPSVRRFMWRFVNK